MAEAAQPASQSQPQLRLEVPIAAVFKLFETTKISTGDSREVPGGVTIKLIESGRIERVQSPFRAVLRNNMVERR
jgi:hypothetical protein